MTEQSEPAIPYGIDLATGQDAEVSQVKSGHRYACPKCRQLLDPRRGDIRRPYFAHHPGATDYACAWRTTEGIQQSLKESEDVAFSAARKLRLFLRRRANSSEGQLYGLLPPMTTADIAATKRAIAPPVVLSSGSAKEVEFADLLPSSSSGWILLDPHSPGFRIEIRPDELSNSGVWGAEAIVVGTTFVGDEFEAELVDRPRHLATGQWVYRISERGKRPQVGTVQLHLGSFDVLGMEVSQEHLAITNDWCPGASIDQASLRVNVVLPLEHSPWVEHRSAIRIEPGKRLLIAITPPEDQDPGLYVYQIPFSDARKLELSRAGAGRPRFLEVRFSEEGASRFLIHWPLLQERDVLVDVVSSRAEKSPIGPGQLARLGLEVGDQSGGVVFLDPLDSPEGTITGSVDQQGLVRVAGIHLRSPEGFSVRLRAEYPQQGGSVIWRDEGQATQVNLPEKIRDTFERGARRVVASFGTLGTVTLRCPGIATALAGLEAERMAREQLRLAEEKQVEERTLRSARRIAMETTVNETLRRIRSPVPRHVSFAWIRSFLQLPPETPVADLVFFRYLVKRQGRQLGVYRPIRPSATNVDQQRR